MDLGRFIVNRACRAGEPSQYPATAAKAAQKSDRWRWAQRAGTR